MIDCKDFQRLHESMKFRSKRKKDQSNGVNWEIVKHIQSEVSKATKFTIQNSNFVSLTCDEVIAMDNASWAIGHGYIV